MADDAQQDVMARLDGSAVTSSDGKKVGKVADIYFDEETLQPEWALVTTGLFGGRHSFVPLTNAELGDEIRLGVTKDQVTGAPQLDDDGELTQDEELELARHYGMQYSEERSGSGLPTSEGEAPGMEAASEAAPTGAAPSGDDAMTRSEEELRVGTVRRPKELVRLRKRLVTEHVTQTVPVEREEIVVEREPITEANVDPAMKGPDLTEAEHEVVLSEDEVVVNKDVVPKERVRLDSTTVEEERQVEETLTKEQIDVEREDSPGR
jgi:uncharacterized protein (TIGR02271 family)